MRRKHKNHKPEVAGLEAAKRLSPCCEAEIVVGGKGMTHWYECSKCGGDPFRCSCPETPPMVQGKFWQAIYRDPECPVHAVAQHSTQQ